MNLKNKVLEFQMVSSIYFSKNPLPWIVVLVPFLIFSGFLGFGFLSIFFFTSLVLILSTTIFKFSKKKPLLVDKPVKDHEAYYIQNNNEADQEDEVGEIEGNLVISHDSECESFDHSYTSEDSDCSDDSISDEESLIEIALPSGHHVDQEEEEEEEEGYKCNLQQKNQGFSPESIFRQPSVIEILAETNEMNEEENLIEIDISMGSIKCSRFEIGE